MKKKYLLAKIIALTLGCFSLSIAFGAGWAKDTFFPGIRGSISDENGNEMEVWTPETGYVVNPEYADELAEWRANFDGSADQYYVVDGHKPTIPSTPAAPTAPATPATPTTPDPNKQFDEIDSLPVGDDYNKATMELKQADEDAFNKYLDYQYKKSLTCEHDDVLVSRIEPTCTEYGSVNYECSKCHTPKTEALDPLGHQYEVVEEVEVICTEDGYKKSVCKVCGEELIENEVKATGHIEAKEEVPATLFKSGHCTIICSVCGEVLQNEIIPQVIPTWVIPIAILLIAGTTAFIILVAKKRFLNE